MSDMDPELDLRRNPRMFSSAPLDEEMAPRRRYMGVAIVLLGVALFVGMLWQVYLLGRMSANENTIPVVQADRTPTKIRPEQPGGLEVPNQDRMVFDRLSNNSEAPSATVENLLSPAEEPLPRPTATSSPTMRAPENTTANTRENTLVRATPSIPPKITSADTAAVENSPLTLTLGSSPSVVANQPPSLILSQDEAVPPATSTEDTNSAEEAAPSTEAAPLPTQQVKKIPTHAPPSETKTAVKKATTVKAKAAPVVHKAKKVPVSAPAKPKTTVAKVAPASTASNSSSGRIQIAALRSEDEARAAVAKLQKEFPTDLGTLTFWITKVTLEGRGTFYRIQAGPVTSDKAKNLCDKLKAQSVGCILVK